MRELKQGEVQSEARVEWTDKTGKKSVDFWMVITDPKRPGTWTTWYDRSAAVGEKAENGEL